MKRLLSVLALLAGLGCSISCQHPAPPASKPAYEPSKRASVPVRVSSPSKKRDPFDRYLDDQKRDVLEPALAQFASRCGADVLRNRSKRASNVGDKWFPTDDLSKPLDEEGTDFFSTYQVWSVGHRVLVESWDINGSDGEERRVLYCFEDSLPKEIEATAWSIPMLEDDSGLSAWGYAQRWQRDSSGKMQRTVSQFVNKTEQPIPKPKLDAEDEKTLELLPRLKPLGELKLPESLLR